MSDIKKFKIDKPIRLIELFGGISCQAQALMNLGVKFEEYRYCDFDKYACQSHNEIMGRNDKPSDITKWKGEDLGICDTDKYCYIMTYSFPCVDLSLAGKGAGMVKGGGTRSGLLWEVERLLKECNELPQVHGKKNKASFDEWCQFLESLGYKNYWKDLNAKDYGVPQSRNRCFMVSLLGDYSYEFPEPIELKLKLQDLLEDEVDEKYYISDKMIKYISANNEKWLGNNGNNSCINRECACTKTTREGQTRADTSDYICENLPVNYKLKQVAQITDKGFTEMTGRVYDSNGLSPTIQTMQVGNRQPKIQVVGGVGEKRSNNGTQYFMQDRIYEGDIANAVCTCANPYYKLKNTFLFSRENGLIKKIDIGTAICARDYKGFCNQEMNSVVENYVSKKYKEFIDEKDISQTNLIHTTKKEIKEIAPTQSTQCGSTTSSSAVLLRKQIIRNTNIKNIMTEIAVTLGTNCGSSTSAGGGVLLKQEMCNKLIQEGKVKENDVIRHNYTTSKNGNCVQSNNESPTLDTRCDCLGVCKNYRIRKLTPTECLRLQGVRDEYSKRMTCSNAQKYKQAGNGIVVDVLMAIFRQML